MYRLLFCFVVARCFWILRSAGSHHKSDSLDPWCRSTFFTTSTTMSNGKVIHCTSAQAYHDALQEAEDRLVVVDCYADWYDMIFVVARCQVLLLFFCTPNCFSFFVYHCRCGPCRAMAPIFEALSTQYPDIVFVKVDVDRAPEVKSLLGVWALPTFAFVRNGQKVSSFTGANERSLRQGLQNNGELGYCSSCIIA